MTPELRAAAAACGAPDFILPWLDRFYDAVEGRGADPIPPEQILRVCRVIDQIVEGVDACMADPKNSTSAPEARA